MHIGTNAVILPNVRIKEGVVMGAGAVVTKDISRGAITVRVPVGVIKIRDEHE